MFSESTGFYLYSSLLQANAAILSILGVFTIFRIQSIQSAIDTIKNSLVISNPNHYPSTEEMDEFDVYTTQEKMAKAKEGYGSHQGGSYHDSTKKNINHRYVNWASKEDKIDKIKNSLLFPSILLAISIIAFAIFIILSKWIHCQGETVELFTFGFIVIFEIVVVFKVIKYIRETIGVVKVVK
jgi:hypothetical protein